jgi:hypothetical protein
LAAASAARKEELHRRGVRLEVFTVAWNVVEGSLPSALASWQAASP